MIYFIILAVLVAGIVLAVIGDQVANEDVFAVGIIMSIILGVVFLVMSGCMIADYACKDVTIETNKQIYNSLTYQLENNLYDNDNDIGKKELYNQVQEWNTDLAKRKRLQRNFWVGIFYPNIYDNFDFIKYGGDKE